MGDVVRMRRGALDDMMDDLLRWHSEGKVAGVAFATIMDDGSIVTGSSATDRQFTMLGAIDTLRYRMLSEGAPDNEDAP